MADQKNSLSQELEELFDIKKAKIRDAKRLNQEAQDAQKDIRLLTLMFRDGIPDLSVQVNDTEIIKWHAESKQLLYSTKNQSHLLEGASQELRVRMRPHLSELVKKAKDFFSDAT